MISANDAGPPEEGSPSMAVPFIYSNRENDPVIFHRERERERKKKKMLDIIRFFSYPVHLDRAIEDSD